MFSLVRNCQKGFQSGCTRLHSHQHWTRIPVIPHPHQHFVLSLLMVSCKQSTSLKFSWCSASCCNQKTWIIQLPKVYFSFLWSSVVMWQVALLSSVIQRPRLRVALPSSVGHLSRSLFSWTFQAMRGKYAEEAQPPFKRFSLEVVGTNSAPFPCWKLVTWLCLAARSAGKCNPCLATGSWATT